MHYPCCGHLHELCCLCFSAASHPKHCPYWHAHEHHPTVTPFCVDTPSPPPSPTQHSAAGAVPALLLICLPPQAPHGGHRPVGLPGAAGAGAAGARPLLHHPHGWVEGWGRVWGCRACVSALAGCHLTPHPSPPPLVRSTAPPPARPTAPPTQPSPPNSPLPQAPLPPTCRIPPPPFPRCRALPLLTPGRRGHLDRDAQLQKVPHPDVHAAGGCCCFSL